MCPADTRDSVSSGLLQMRQIQPQEGRLQKQSQSSCKHWLDRVLTPLKVGRGGCLRLVVAKNWRTHYTTGVGASTGLTGAISVLSSQQPCRYLVLFRHEETEGQEGVMTLV